MKLRDIRDNFPRPDYHVTIELSYFIDYFDRHVTENGLIINPDFQRGHVWTEQQQIAFVEHALQGGNSGRVIWLNHPNWMGSFEGEFVLMDGLQRYTAMRAFLENKIKAFGYYLNEFEDDVRCISYCFDINITKFKTREEVIRAYLSFNEGGTPHAKEEIERVRKMLEEVK